MNNSSSERASQPFILLKFTQNSHKFCGNFCKFTQILWEFMQIHTKFTHNRFHFDGNFVCICLIIYLKRYYIIPYYFIIRTYNINNIIILVGSLLLLFILTHISHFAPRRRCWSNKTRKASNSQISSARATI